MLTVYSMLTLSKLYDLDQGLVSALVLIRLWPQSKYKANQSLISFKIILIL